MNPEIFILGDSHSLTLSRGKEAWEAEGRTAPIKDWAIRYVDNGNVVDLLAIEMKDGKKILHPLLDRTLISLKILNEWSRKNLVADRPHELALLFGYVQMHRICFNPRWAELSILGSSVTSPKGAIPLELIYETIVEQFSAYALAVRMLKEMGYNVSLISGPPPVDDISFVNQKLPNFKTIMESESRALCFTALTRAIAGIADANAIPFRNFAPLVSDERGFLKREFWGDGIHANATYGKIVLEELARRTAVAA